MKKRELKLKSAIISAIDIFVAFSLYLSLDSLLQNINVIRVPARLLLFLAYFGFGIILSILSLAGSARLINVSARLINILTLSSTIIMLLGGIFVTMILPYE